MADSVSLSNTWICYIQNNPYVYPKDNVSVMEGEINTGWHIFPNMFWSHLITPRQWAELIINYEAYHVSGITISAFNMIPMTQQLAIQGTNIFTAFNNTIYALGYTDKFYETSWHNYYDYSDTANGNHNLLYKEGLLCQYNSDVSKRYDLPIYKWSLPDSRATTANTYNNSFDLQTPANNLTTVSGVYPAGLANNDTVTQYYQRPTGVLWDPMNRPEDLMELRPGKNTIRFGWECHECDANRWFNLDLMVKFHPYNPESPYHSYRSRPGMYRYTSTTDPNRLASRYETNPAINDYTIPNYNDIPVVPMAWWWKEMSESILPFENADHTHEISFWKYLDLYFSGTEYELYKYGPTQSFIKMVPIFDSTGTHIDASAQISVKTTLHLQCKKRRTAMYAPTWGPFNWHNTYSARAIDRAFRPALIRYRTGGARRTWQNVSTKEHSNAASDIKAHPRVPPFSNTVQTAGTGQDGTRAARRMAPYPKPRTPTAPPMETEETVPYQRIQSPLYPPLEHISGHQI
uniref:VP1 n=1 Tax=Chufflevirus sp. TaxID=2814903 RepID=A0A897ZGG0_9VIRU|nr:VP1 [Chufflevirus sp.]